MNPIAIEHAFNRLEKARKAVRRLEQSDTIYETKDAWTDFLLAAAAFYSKLEQGAKSNDKSGGWYSEIKGERKSDPLLSYIHHARNSDEHGLAAITKDLHQTTYRHPTMDLKATINSEKAIPEDMGWDFIVAGETVTVTEGVRTKTTKGVILVEVVDRPGITFPVPSSHRGKVMDFDQPVYAAKTALAYLEEVFEAARSLT